MPLAPPLGIPLANVSTRDLKGNLATLRLPYPSLRPRHRLVLAPLSASTLTEQIWLSFFDSHQGSAFDMTTSNRYSRPRCQGTCGENARGQSQRRVSPLPRVSAVTGEREDLQAFYHAKRLVGLRETHPCKRGRLLLGWSIAIPIISKRAPAYSWTQHLVQWQLSK